jgi:hypothetical protein
MRRKLGLLLLGLGAALCAATFVDGVWPGAYAPTRYLGVGYGSLVVVRSDRPINLRWWATDAVPGYFQLAEVISTGAGWCAALPLCIPGSMLVGAGIGVIRAGRQRCLDDDPEPPATSPGRERVGSAGRS